MSETATSTQSNGTGYIELACDIVSAYVSNNSVPTAELPALLNSIHQSIAGIAGGSIGPIQSLEKQAPAVNPKKSVTHDYIICLEDGKQFKSLRRHLSSNFNMTPEQYRQKWGLAADYPMVAPAYAQQRSDLARRMGLGRKAEGVARGGRGRKKTQESTAA